MKRRGVIKHLAVATGAFLAAPAWANGWTNASLLPMSSSLSDEQADLLAEVVETIIPAGTMATDIKVPGARELGVHAFVQKMVTDCYEKKVQDNLKNGLDTVSAMSAESFGKPFSQGDATQRLAVLTRLSTSTDASQKEFIALVKSLTIQGYTTSEYVMTKFYNYQMAPGHYYGCVPVPAKAITQAK